MIRKIKIKKDENLLAVMHKLRNLVLKLLYEFLQVLKYSKKLSLKKNDQKKIRFFSKIYT